MRFIQFLVEEPGKIDWIPKAIKANQQRARNATKNRAQKNKQSMQAANQQQRDPNGRFIRPTINTGLEQRPPGSMATVDFKTGKNIEQPQDHPAGLERRSPSSGPDTINFQQLPPELIQRAKGNREDAIEMLTLLGAIYQTLRRNPQVELTPPKIVTQSKNKQDLMSLFNIAKHMDLPQLAAMSQEIKQHAASPGANIPPSGTQNTPQTPGQTPGGKTMLQKLFNTIQNAAKSLSPQDFLAARKKLDRAAQDAKSNPSNNTQQPIGKPIVTQG